MNELKRWNKNDQEEIQSGGVDYLRTMWKGRNQNSKVNSWRDFEEMLRDLGLSE